MPGWMWQDRLPIEGEAAVETVPQERSEAAPPIVEAQAWVRNGQGQVVLVAQSQQTAVGQPLGCEG